MVGIARWSVVLGESRTAIGIGGAEGEFGKGGLGGLSGKGGLSPLFDAHPAITSKKGAECCIVPRATHAQAVGSAEGVSPCRFLATEPYGSRCEERGGFPRTTPRARDRMTLAGVRRSAGGFHISLRLGSDGGWWGIGVH